MEMEILKLLKHKRKILLALVVLIVVAGIVIFTCDRIIEKASANKIYTDVQSIPANNVGLLLGTSKMLSNGYENAYYRYRINAAADLLKSGKIKYLIISGDNSRKEYDEPSDMRADLIAAGIDSTVIYLDYAGFRTFDSIIRLKKIFGQDKVTIISQQFHNQRAIYIAKREGINAIGYNAKDVSKNYGFRVRVREKLARVKVFVDMITGKEPKFLGEKIIIPSP
jgi:SanA protein